MSSEQTSTRVLCFTLNVVFGIVTAVNELTVPKLEGCQWNLGIFLRTTLICNQLLTFLISLTPLLDKHSLDLFLTSPRYQGTRRMLLTVFSLQQALTYLVHSSIAAVDFLSCGEFEGDVATFHWIIIVLGLPYGICMVVYVTKNTAHICTMCRFSSFRTHIDKMYKRMASLKTVVHTQRGVVLYKELNRQADKIYHSHWENLEMYGIEFKPNLNSPRPMAPVDLWFFKKFHTFRLEPRDFVWLRENVQLLCNSCWSPFRVSDRMFACLDCKYCVHWECFRATAQCLVQKCAGCGSGILDKLRTDVALYHPRQLFGATE